MEFYFSKRRRDDSHILCVFSIYPPPSAEMDRFQNLQLALHSEMNFSIYYLFYKSRKFNMDRFLKACPIFYDRFLNEFLNIYFIFRNTYIMDIKKIYQQKNVLII